MSLLMKVSTVAVAAFLLAGCASETGPVGGETPRAEESPRVVESIDPRQAEYERLISEEYPAPEGHEWPEKLPAPVWSPDGGTVDGIVLMLWGCMTLENAWDAYYAGDADEAERLVETMYASTPLWSLHTPIEFGGGYTRDAGWSGRCQLVLDDMTEEALDSRSLRMGTKRDG